MSTADEPTAPLVRLLSVDEAEPDARVVLEGGLELYGRLLYTWQALAHRPEILVAYMPYLRSIAGPGSLEQRLKELVEVRTVVLNRCRYSTAHRLRSARVAGVDERSLSAAASGRLEGLEEREQLALRLCEEDTLARSGIRFEDAPQIVSAELLHAVKVAFTDPEIVELLATISLWNALARFHRTMGFALDMDPPPPDIDALL